MPSGRLVAGEVARAAETSGRKTTPGAFKIYKDGTLFYAENLLGGADITPNANAIALTNSALLAMPNGGTAYFMASADKYTDGGAGTILTIPPSTGKVFRLIGEGMTYFAHQSSPNNKSSVIIEGSGPQVLQGPQGTIGTPVSSNIGALIIEGIEFQHNRVIGDNDAGLIIGRINTVFMRNVSVRVKEFDEITAPPVPHSNSFGIRDGTDSLGVQYGSMNHHRYDQIYILGYGEGLSLQTDHTLVTDLHVTNCSQMGVGIGGSGTATSIRHVIMNVTSFNCAGSVIKIGRVREDPPNPSFHGVVLMGIVEEKNWPAAGAKLAMLNNVSGLPCVFILPIRGADSVGDATGDLTRTTIIPIAAPNYTILRGDAANKLSSTFAIDSTGVKTVTVAHSLGYTPNIEDCYLTVLQVTAVDDWAFNMVKITATDATNVTAKVNVSTASATAGATARLGLRVGKA